MIAEIIAAGSEMLTPYRVDTNSLFLTEQLNDVGVAVAFKSVVGDSLDHLVSAARTALARADIVMFSGGLGPTRDDLTREAVAGSLGLALERRDDLMQMLLDRYAARGIAMPPNNAQQADVLEGAEVLPNPNGTAVGQYWNGFLEHQARIVVLLPGPPKELKALFLAEVKPRLRARLPGSHLRRRMLRMALIPESQVDARCAPICEKYTDVETTILAGSAEIQLHFSCAKPTAEEAQARVDEVAGKVEQEMEDAIFSAQGESLEEIVLLHLGMRGHTLATAESCTGGLLSQRITAVPGSSRMFLGGVVAYTNAIKSGLVSVDAEVLERDGAISEATARALAEGVRERTGASVGVGITGLAGPGVPASGPDAGKPVGLVYVAIAGLPAGAGGTTEVKELRLAGDRERVRLWASQHALEILRRLLLSTT